MARQIEGSEIEKTYSSEGLTFYKKGGKYYVRLKSTLSSKKVKKSKQFERTRENSTEFAVCSSFGAMIRLVFREFVVGVSGRHQDRLLKLLYEFRIDDINPTRGVRNIQNGLGVNGNSSKLIGFAFDENNELNPLLNKISAVDYVSRIVNFIPSLDLNLDFYCTHFEFVSIIGHIRLPVVNFSLGVDNFIKSIVTSGKIPVNLSSPLSLNLAHDISTFQDFVGGFRYFDNSKRLELYGFGILFYLDVGGVFVPVAQNKTISQITNVLLNNDLVVIDVIGENTKTVLHNLGHIPLVWLLDENKILSEALILHSSGNEFSVITFTNQPFQICYYMRVGVSIPFTNTSEVLVSHNLGRYVAVQVLDDLGRVCGCNIQFNSLNSFVVRFGGVFSGTVVYYP